MTWRRELVTTGRPSVIVGGDGALDGLEGRAQALAKAGRRCFLITDGNVDQAWGSEARRLLGPALEGVVVLEPGEPTKSLSVAGEVYEQLAPAGARRDDVIIALGGGVVGDLAGFVAATYHRGVEFWQVPTSLLAQVDSSVGGKVGINLLAGKNLVGAFYQPDVVLIDPRVLSTLPADELVNGLGEVVKYGLLAGPDLLGQIEEEAAALLEGRGASLDEIVRRCVEYKALIVEADEREQGRRAVLNLGHTTAHAVELLGDYRGLSHGRAVALGLLVALALSEECLGLEPSVRERVRRLLLELELPVELPEADVPALMEATRRDKKMSAKGRGFVLLEALGRPVWGVDVDDEEFRAALGTVAA